MSKKRLYIISLVIVCLSQILLFSSTFNGIDKNVESPPQSNPPEIPEGPEGDYYRFNKNIPHGQIRSIHYWSDMNGLERPVNVYVPAEYEKNPEKKK